MSSKFRDLYKRNGLVLTNRNDNAERQLRHRKDNRRETFNSRRNIENECEDLSSNKRVERRIKKTKAVLRNAKINKTKEQLTPFVVGIVRHKIHSPPFLHEPLNARQQKTKFITTPIQSFAPRNYNFRGPAGLKLKDLTPRIEENHKSSPFTLNSLLKKSDKKCEKSLELDFRNITTRPRIVKFADASPLNFIENNSKIKQGTPRSNHNKARKQLLLDDYDEPPIFGRSNLKENSRRAVDNFSKADHHENKINFPIFKEEEIKSISVNGKFGKPAESADLSNKQNSNDLNYSATKEHSCTSPMIVSKNHDKNNELISSPCEKIRFYVEKNSDIESNDTNRRVSNMPSPCLSEIRYSTIDLKSNKKTDSLTKRRTNEIIIPLLGVGTRCSGLEMSVDSICNTPGCEKEINSDSASVTLCQTVLDMSTPTIIPNNKNSSCFQETEKNKCEEASLKTRLSSAGKDVLMPPNTGDDSKKNPVIIEPISSTLAVAESNILGTKEILEKTCSIEEANSGHQKNIFKTTSETIDKQLENVDKETDTIEAPELINKEILEKTIDNNLSCVSFESSSLIKRVSTAIDIEKLAAVRQTLNFEDETFNKHKIICSTPMESLDPLHATQDHKISRNTKESPSDKLTGKIIINSLRKSVTNIAKENDNVFDSSRSKEFSYVEKNSINKDIHMEMDDTVSLPDIFTSSLLNSTKSQEIVDRSEDNADKSTSPMLVRSLTVSPTYQEEHSDSAAKTEKILTTEKNKNDEQTLNNEINSTYVLQSETTNSVDIPNVEVNEISNNKSGEGKLLKCNISPSVPKTVSPKILTIVLTSPSDNKKILLKKRPSDEFERADSTHCSTINKPEFIISRTESPNVQDKILHSPKMNESNVQKSQKVSINLQDNVQVVDLISDDEEDYSTFISSVLARQGLSNLASPKSRSGRSPLASVTNVPKIRVTPSNSPKTPRFIKENSPTVSSVASPMRLLCLRTRTVSVTPSPKKRTPRRQKKTDNQRV